MTEHYDAWQKLAPRGLVVIGAGLSIVLEAAGLKVKGAAFWRWFTLGTLGLAVFNWGIAIFGEAVKHRALYEVELGSASRDSASRLERRG